MRALLLAALLLVATEARAAAEEPIGDGRLGRVRIGWDGSVSGTTVSPVTVVLTNKDGRERVIRVAVSPHGAPGAEATVTLAPNGTGRASFILRVRDGLEATLSEDGRLIASSRYATSNLPDHAVLEVDGSPGTRASLTLLENAPASFSCRAEDMPVEAACYQPFEVVVLRLVDPAAMDGRAVLALRDFVRAGGSVVVSGTGKTAGFFDALGPPGSLPSRRHGLGRVSLVASDLGAISSAAEVDRRSLTGPAVRAPRRSFGLLHLSLTENEALKESRFAYACFLLGYALVGCPVIALVRRRVKRRRRAFGIAAAIVASFIVVGAVVASVARSGKGRAGAISRLLIPTEGEPVVVAEAVVASGGSLRPDVSVDGEALAVTAVTRTQETYWVAESAATKRCWAREASPSRRSRCRTSARRTS